MKTRTLLRLGGVWLMALVGGMAQSGNITIFDGQGYNGSSYVPGPSGSKDGNYFTGSGSSTSVGTAKRSGVDYGKEGAYWTSSRDEDQEVEPGTPINNIISGQGWDLEAFVTTGGKNLQMIAGYSFQYGTDAAHSSSGDIFIDVTGNAVYGPAANGTGSNGTGLNSLFGYDYAIVFERNSNGSLKNTYTYTVYSLTGATDATVYYSQNQESNPWKYASGGTAVAGYANVPYSITSGLSDAQTGFKGGTHYALNFNLDFLTDAQFANATLHYTMMCGNDNLMGHVPDGGMTLAMLGMGVGGLALVNRRLRR